MALRVEPNDKAGFAKVAKSKGYRNLSAWHRDQLQATGVMGERQRADRRLEAGPAMIGWITTILTSGPACKALGLLLTAVTIALFLLNLRSAGERAGRLAERLSTSEKTHEIQRRMLDAASRRPADRDALADRLRDGQF